MADTAEIGKVVILWDNEVRKAAKLLREWHDCTDDSMRDAMAIAAFNACLVALWGIKEDSPLVMLGSGEIKHILSQSPNFELVSTADQVNDNA